MCRQSISWFPASDNVAVGLRTGRGGSERCGKCENVVRAAGFPPPPLHIPTPLKLVIQLVTLMQAPSAASPSHACFRIEGVHTLFGDMAAVPRTPSAVDLEGEQLLGTFRFVSAMAVLHCLVGAEQLRGHACALDRKQ